MVFGQLCAPALIYIVFSITQIVIDSMKGLYNTAMIKLFVSILFTILLNHLCERGLGIISWIIVFIPFMLMSLIVALLLAMFGLDPTTGKLNLQQQETPKKEYDAREKAIVNYSMNRTTEDYKKRLDEMGYIDLKDKNGQNMINPAYDDSHYSNNSEQSYELVQSGSARNKIRTRILAEELYYALEGKVSSESIKLDTDVGNKVRTIFLNNCDVAINIYYEDIYYRFEKIYGIFDLEDEKQSQAIANALADIKEWGVMRNADGKVSAFSDFDVNRFRDYTKLLNDYDSTWASQVVESYNGRIKKQYESKCTKIQINLDQFAKSNDVTFDDVYTSGGDSAYTNLLEQAYDSSLLNSNFVAPTSCTDELKEMCKVRKKGECRPCNESEVIPGNSATPAQVACPYLCSADDFNINDASGQASESRLRKSQLCGYCNLCKGPSQNNPITNLPVAPPSGKEWVSLLNLESGNITTASELPETYEDNGEQLGLGNKAWWKIFYPTDSDGDRGTVNIRSCANDGRNFIGSDGSVNRREGTFGGGQTRTQSGDAKNRYSGDDEEKTVQEKNVSFKKSIFSSDSFWMPENSNSYLIIDLGSIQKIAGVAIRSNFINDANTDKICGLTDADLIAANEECPTDDPYCSGKVTLCDTNDPENSRCQPVQRTGGNGEKRCAPPNWEQAKCDDTGMVCGILDKFKIDIGNGINSAKSGLMEAKNVYSSQGSLIFKFPEGQGGRTYTANFVVPQMGRYIKIHSMTPTNKVGLKIEAISSAAATDGSGEDTSVANMKLANIASNKRTLSSSMLGEGAEDNSKIDGEGWCINGPNAQERSITLDLGERKKVHAIVVQGGEDSSNYPLQMQVQTKEAGGNNYAWSNQPGNIKICQNSDGETVPGISRRMYCKSPNQWINSNDFDLNKTPKLGGSVRKTIELANKPVAKLVKVIFTDWMGKNAATSKSCARVDVKVTDL